MSKASRSCSVKEQNSEAHLQLLEKQREESRVYHVSSEDVGPETFWKVRLPAKYFSAFKRTS